MPDQGAKFSRSILPIPDRTHIGLTTYDAKDPNSKFPPIEPLYPPKGAPNVLIVLLDDVGFAASSAFGGPCETPNFDKLASDGLKYNRFHTTALCSPLLNWLTQTSSIIIFPPSRDVHLDLADFWILVQFHVGVNGRVNL